MARKITVCDGCVEFSGKGVPSGMDGEFARTLQNFFGTLEMLFPVTGIEPDQIVLLPSRVAVEIFCVSGEMVPVPVNCTDVNSFAQSLTSWVRKQLNECCN